MSAIPRLDEIALDCPEPAALARFYAALLGWPADVPSPGQADDWISLRPPGGGIGLGFQRSPEYRPPTWPDPDVQQMLHLDFVVDDVGAAHDRALALGARHLDTQETFRVYADPAGHPFCLCVS